jgi:hypothetical protein
MGFVGIRSKEITIGKTENCICNTLTVCGKNELFVGPKALCSSSPGQRPAVQKSNINPIRHNGPTDSNSKYWNCWPVGPNSSIIFVLYHQGGALVWGNRSPFRTANGLIYKYVLISPARKKEPVMQIRSSGAADCLRYFQASERSVYIW